MSDPLKPSANILIKLGSLVVHYEELNSPRGHHFDQGAIDTIMRDEELKEWFRQMNELAFLPVKRNV